MFQRSIDSMKVPLAGGVYGREDFAWTIGHVKKIFLNYSVWSQGWRVGIRTSLLHGIFYIWR